MHKYPDITYILAKKTTRRKQLAQLSFEEKIAIVNRWRQLTKKIKGTQLAKRYQSRDKH